MESMMTRLSQRLHGSQLPMTKPTVAMDRGIATEENVKWLRENGYHYIVIKREDGAETYRQQFETERETFHLVRSKESIYGESSNVYVRKESVGEDICRVLCISEGKARKERAIDEKKTAPFLEDIEKLRQSILRGSIKDPTKIHAKLQKLLCRHGKYSAKYEAFLEITDGKVTGITLTSKPETAEPLYGCYVIESSHTEISAEEIWKLYMTLSRVENAFRSMKETLGMRPIYHQTAERSSAHLFLTVLAYHLLATIENMLAQQGDTRTWGTIRKVMSTLTRGTVTMKDTFGVTYAIRVNDEAEDVHQDIFDKLKIHPAQNLTIAKIGSDSSL
jgi:transposase